MNWDFRIALFGIFAAASLSAAIPAPTGTIEESARPQGGRGALKVDLNSWTYTNAFTDWNGKKPAGTDAPGSPIQIVNQVIVSTPAFGKMDLVAVPTVVLQPMEGYRLQLSDPTFGLQGTLVDNGSFSWWARFEAIAPFTPASAAQGQLLSPQTVQVFAYRIPGTKLRADLVLVPSVIFHADGQTKTGLYASPRLYYLASDSWWLVGIFESGWEAKKGQGLMNLDISAQPNLGFGFRYTSANGAGLWVQPFLSVYPFGQRVAESAHLGVFFGGPLL